MVSSASMIAMAISGLLCFIFPIAVFLYFKKKEDLNLKPFFIGMLIFFVFTQILEKLLHFVVIGNGLISNPILFAVYGALAAGIFEEVGRFVAFKTVLKNMTKWKDGLSYGIGHGGIEAILIGTFGAITSIVYSNLINSGTFDTVLTSNLSEVQIQQLNQMKDSLIQSNAFLSLIGFAERIFAFGIQIALTMVVLYAIRNRKNIFLFFAIILHALLDFSAGLYQTGVIKNIFTIEGIVFIWFIASIVFLIKIKKVFCEEEMRDNR